ncbi:MAG: S-layer protein [Candidatus Peregrinibacteria bacterium Gr01-1014_25]|nr:MAG: S-layer protein [Candidatus Peregrinibacteria bacterium Gr01-1014_25]
MRRASLLLAPFLLIPAVALADLDFADTTERYNDAPFPAEESAAISLLTNLDAVEGYPDGTFRPTRSLNRAEFLRIVLASHPLGKSWAERQTNLRCFPDVRSDAWYAPSVCAAKERGIVGGYPDGWFRAERTVNYAEAVKILATLYSYDVEKNRAPWYAPYVDAAASHDVSLPDAVPDTFLSRGQMARLAAMFRAEHDGELDAYWKAVTGTWLPSISSSSASSSSAPSSISSASSSSSIAMETFPDYPAVSRLLLLGSRTPTLLDGVFLSSEDAVIRIPELKLRSEIRSIDKMFLVDENGVELAQLTLATTDETDKRIWRVELPPENGNILRAGVARRLGIRVTLKQPGFGTPRELWEVESFSIVVRGVESGTSRQLVPQTPHQPTHQITLARIASVRSLPPETTFIRPGPNRRLASFTFSGAIAPGASLTLKSILVAVDSTNVRVETVRIGDGSPVNTADCAADPANATLFSCTIIPQALRGISASSPRTLSIEATVSLLAGKTEGTVRAWLGNAGSPTGEGVVRWDDGTSEYGWMDIPSPVATGPEWKVQP